MKKSGADTWGVTMNELEARIKCKFCTQRFELFEDLQKHRCGGRSYNQKIFNEWQQKIEAKVKSFENLTGSKKYENMG